MSSSEQIKEIRKIEIFTRRLVNDQLAGQYQSVFKGRGMAFDEVRQYQPGDDIRLIDWNVSARMNDIYVKLFVEEREMTLMLLVDMSASTNFGTGQKTKRAVAAMMAAVVAFSAIKNNDRVGLIIFTDQVEKFVPPKKGKKHVLRVISEIQNFNPESKLTDLAAGLEFLGRVTKRRSVVFMLSDFFQLPPDGEAPDPKVHAVPKRLERALRITSRRHDLIPVTITDPLEVALTGLGLVNIHDPETGEMWTFDSSGPEAREHARYMEQAQIRRQGLFRRLKMDFVALTLPAHDGGDGKKDKYMERVVVPPLVAFFKARERRMRR